MLRLPVRVSAKVKVQHLHAVFSTLKKIEHYSMEIVWTFIRSRMDLNFL